MCGFFFLVCRLEVEDDAENLAENLQNSSTLENILQRLQNFEVHEHNLPCKRFRVIVLPYSPQIPLKQLRARLHACSVKEVSEFDCGLSAQLNDKRS